MLEMTPSDYNDTMTRLSLVLNAAMNSQYDKYRPLPDHTVESLYTVYNGACTAYIIKEKVEPQLKFNFRQEQNTTPEEQPFKDLDVSFRISSGQPATLFILPQASDQILLTTATFTQDIKTAQIRSDVVITMERYVDVFLPRVHKVQQCLERPSETEQFGQCVVNKVRRDFARSNTSCVPIMLQKFLPDYGLCRDAKENRAAVMRMIQAVYGVVSHREECLVACNSEYVEAKSVPVTVGDKDGELR